ncbi:MAG TPA: DMT family transporter [Candidatus Gracilibacteria bacterium]|nr:DMT family transporter [Candidatus Gracilibacteria bacterium]
MKFSTRSVGYAAGLLASFFWGIHSVIIRHLTQQGVDPNLIAGLRLYIGAATIFVILMLQRVTRRGKEKKTAPFTFHPLFILAALSLGINFLLFQTGLQYTLASDANLIQNFSPVAVLIMSSIFLRHRIREIAPNTKYWMSIFQIVLVGSIGASLVLITDVNNAIVPSQQKLQGDVMAFVGMLFFSLFVIFSSEFSKIQPKISSLWTTMLTLAVAALPVSLLVPFRDLPGLTADQWYFIVFIGIFSTGVAYWLWIIASKRLNVVPLTLNLVYIGIITVLTEVFFLDLLLDWKIVLGGALMIAASVLAEITNEKARKYSKSLTKVH